MNVLTSNDMLSKQKTSLDMRRQLSLLLRVSMIPDYRLPQQHLNLFCMRMPSETKKLRLYSLQFLLCQELVRCRRLRRFRTDGIGLSIQQKWLSCCRSWHTAGGGRCETAFKGQTAA